MPYGAKEKHRAACWFTPGCRFDSCPPRTSLGSDSMQVGTSRCTQRSRPRNRETIATVPVKAGNLHHLKAFLNHCWAWRRRPHDLGFL